MEDVIEIAVEHEAQEELEELEIELEDLEEVLFDTIIIMLVIWARTIPIVEKIFVLSLEIPALNDRTKHCDPLLRRFSCICIMYDLFDWHWH